MMIRWLTFLWPSREDRYGLGYLSEGATRYWLLRDSRERGGRGK